MKFDFFTFGGSFLWEDVFFYQKWRIQRNCNTKTYRLLDSWDIRRASGSFETCQKAFIKYINSYEIPPQQGKMVVLLHGYGDSKNIFKQLWRKLILTNSAVAALNYPSFFHSSIASAHQLLFFLNHMADITDVSFVTKGSGNLVLQQALNILPDRQLFRERMRIRNVVEINPVVKGSLLCDFLSSFGFFRLICGPMLKDMTSKSVKNLPSLPSDVRSLKIFSDSKAYTAFIKLLEKCNFPIESQPIPGKNVILIKGSTAKTMKNEEILNKTVNFIKNGKI